MSSSNSLRLFGKAVAESGLLASTCGNVSLRVDEKTIIVSASGSELGSLGPDDATFVALDDGSSVGTAKPSMEADLHRRVYLARPSAGAIVHCQSRSATLLACMNDPPRNLDLVPEIPAYVRAHAYVPWGMPGSPKLAADVGEAFEDEQVTVVQMRNHGQVIIGGTWQKAVRRGLFFELACWLASNAANLRTIPDEDAERLRTFARDV